MMKFGGAIWVFGSGAPQGNQPDFSKMTEGKMGNVTLLQDSDPNSD